MTQRELNLKALVHLNALVVVGQQAVHAQKVFSPAMASETQGKVDAAQKFIAELRAELEKPEPAQTGTAGGTGTGAARAKLDEAAQQAQAGAQVFSAGLEDAYDGVVKTLQAAQPLVGALAALVRGR